MEESWKMNGNKMKKDNFYHNFIIIYAMLHEYINYLLLFMHKFKKISSIINL